jgi:hypothetical protein
LNLKGLLNSTTIADRILLFILILLSLSGIIFIKEVLPKGHIVWIEVNGHPVYLLPIEKDRIVSVNGSEGNTIVEIKNHKVRITESPCDNKLCIQQGWIEKGSIVCLPNRVVVIVGTPEDELNKRVDAITG